MKIRNEQGILLQILQPSKGEQGHSMKNYAINLLYKKMGQP